MLNLSETTEQLRARDTLSRHISEFAALTGRARRTAAKQIRDLAVLFPWLGDLIPDDVYCAVYRVGAMGTVAP